MKIMVKFIFLLSWCINDLWGTKVMYCYVLKLLFLTPIVIPNPVVTSMYSEVRDLVRQIVSISRKSNDNHLCHFDLMKEILSWTH